MNDNAPFPSPSNVYGPITPTQMLERTAALLRENFKLFFGIVLVVIAVEIVVGGVLGATALWLARWTITTAPITTGLIVIPAGLAGAALIYIVTQIVQGALFVATDARLAGARISVGDACSRATNKAGKLVGIALLIALRIFGYILLIDIVLGVPLIFIAIGMHPVFQPHPSPGSLLSMGFAAILILLVFFVVYLVALYWLIVRYALSIPAALAENLSITDSIRRSIRLSSGSRSRLYVLFLFIFCIYVGIAVVTFPVQMMTATGSLLHPAAPTLTFTVVSGLIAVFRIVVSGFVIAIMGIATALCYFDLRVRKEDFGRSTASPVVDAPAPLIPPTPGLPTEDFPMA